MNEGAGETPALPRPQVYPVSGDSDSYVALREMGNRAPQSGYE
jgi:hypothetical protein